MASRYRSHKRCRVEILSRSDRAKGHNVTSTVITFLISAVVFQCLRGQTAIQADRQTDTVASLRSMSPGAATDGVTLFFPQKSDDLFSYCPSPLRLPTPFVECSL